MRSAAAGPLDTFRHRAWCPARVAPYTSRFSCTRAAAAGSPDT